MKLLIQNISKKVTAHSLGAIFSTFGKVESITIFSNATIISDSKRAEVLMPNEEEALKAMEQLNGCFVDGFVLTVVPAPAEKESMFANFYKRICHYIALKEKNLSL